VSWKSCEGGDENAEAWSQWCNATKTGRAGSQHAAKTGRAGTTYHEGTAQMAIGRAEEGHEHAAQKEQTGEAGKQNAAKIENGRAGTTYHGGTAQKVNGRAEDQCEHAAHQGTRPMTSGWTDEISEEAAHR
jgi:hypothetical protein